MKPLAMIILLPAAIMAQNYTATRSVIDSVEVIRLADAAHKTEVTIVPSAGNNAYEMKVNGKNIFWTTAQSPATFKEKPSGGNPFLAPWANRIDQDAFYANGKKYTFNLWLNNVARDGNRNPMHGLLQRWANWQVVSVKAGVESAEATSRLEFWKYPDLMAQFPFAHTIDMTYRLQNGVLEVETVLQNHSNEPMPVALGYHTWYRLYDAPRDDWKVHIPARDHVVLSKVLIPTGERRPLKFPDPLPLKDVSLDDVFTNLIRDASGKAEFWVQAKNEKISVVYGPKYLVSVIYSPARGRNIAIEPMAALTNAMNMNRAGLYDELQSVPPGGTWRESFWIRAEGF